MRYPILQIDGSKKEEIPNILKSENLTLTLGF
jgi:hypothetical protein